MFQHSIALVLLATVSLLACTSPAPNSTALNTDSSPNPISGTLNSPSPEIISSTTPSASSAQAVTTSIDISLNLDKLQEKYPNNFKLLTSSQIELIVESPRLANSEKQIQNPVDHPESVSEFQRRFSFSPKDFSSLQANLTLDAMPLFTPLTFRINHKLDAELDPCLITDSYLVLEHKTFLSGTGTLVLEPHVTSNGDLVAIEETRITGQVFDSNNQPISGAIVSLSTGSGCVKKNLSVHTDSEGKYVLDGVPTGVEINLLASAANVVSQNRKIVAKSNKQGDSSVNIFDFGGPENPSSALK